MAPLYFNLTYAGVPFMADDAVAVRPDIPTGDYQKGANNPISKQRPLPELVEELNRIIPFKYIQAFSQPANYQGRNIGNLAIPNTEAANPNPEIKIGDWYYPNTASRWSIFTGLSSSTLVKTLLAITGGNTAKEFNMQVVPISPDNLGDDSYNLTTNMYMLPPRPLAENGGQYDGIYLVQLVDERWYWQNSPISFTIDSETTWGSLIDGCAAILGVVITYSPIPDAYTVPEKDSQFWMNLENVPTVLDAIAYNVGRVVIRNLDGTYELLTSDESQLRAETNRGNTSSVVRTAGGDLFSSGTLLRVGNLTQSRNYVVPENIRVSFPKYVTGDDPVPHFLNNRYGPDRPSAWYEQSYGSVWTEVVPITSGGSFVSGLIGISDYTIHSTAKALISGEQQIIPYNQSGLTSLALEIARDYYTEQVGLALDEVYPGTFKWLPEGLHDIVWTYSPKMRQGVTRVTHNPWNQSIREMQHATPVSSGFSTNLRGVGGLSVAQTVRDCTSGSVSSTLSTDFLSGNMVVELDSVAYLPTQDRWKGQINEEIILLDGTSGGISGGINVVFRGIDGTTVGDHLSGDVVTQIYPSANYGTNLVTYGEGQFVYPGVQTSGGISEVKVIPQTQTVRVLSDQAADIDGIPYYSGQVNLYNPSAAVTGSPYVLRELIWVVDRNYADLTSGARYPGQLVGYANSNFESDTGSLISGHTSPVYLTNATPVPNNETVTKTQWRYECVNGVNKAYRTIVTYRPGQVPLFSEEEYDHDEGCCACGVAPSPCCGGDSPLVICITPEDFPCIGVTPFDVTYNATGANGAGWYSETFECVDEEVTHELYFRLTCDTDVWTMEVYCDDVLETDAEVAVNCTPFGFVATLTGDGTGCLPAGDVTLTGVAGPCNPPPCCTKASICLTFHDVLVDGQPYQITAAWSDTESGWPIDFETTGEWGPSRPDAGVSGTFGMHGLLTCFSTSAGDDTNPCFFIDPSPEPCYGFFGGATFPYPPPPSGPGGQGFIAYHPGLYHNQYITEAPTCNPLHFVIGLLGSVEVSQGLCPPPGPVCCLGYQIPNVLCASPNGLNCPDGPFNLTFSSSDPQGPGWYSDYLCLESNTLRFRLWCNTTNPLLPVWTWEEYCNAAIAGTTTVSAFTCSPFTATVSQWITNGPCVPSTGVSIYITEGSCNGIFPCAGGGTFDPIYTPGCCPGLCFPAALTLTVTGGSAVDGTYTLNLNLNLAGWVADAPGGDQWLFGCVGIGAAAKMQLQLNFDTGGGVASDYCSITCPPDGCFAGCMCHPDGNSINWQITMGTGGPCGPCTPCTGITGWVSPGWYCVRNESDVCEPLELLEEDRCDGSIEICSGPYANEAVAEAACGGGGGTQTFITTSTWEAPAGVTSVTAECWGGGGSGSEPTNGNRAGAGGGGGAYASKVVTVIPGNTYNVIVGTGGPNSGNSGTAGGDTIFGPLPAGVAVKAVGGSGGVGLAGGAGGAAGSSVGTTTHSGGAGGGGAASITTGGGGGSSAGPSADGNAGTGAGPGGGAGGIAPAGGGNGGQGGAASSGSGFAGVAPGGGGGARGGDGDFAAAGANGKVILTW